MCRPQLYRKFVEFLYKFGDVFIEKGKFVKMCVVLILQEFVQAVGKSQNGLGR